QADADSELGEAVEGVGRHQDGIKRRSNEAGRAPASHSETGSRKKPEGLNSVQGLSDFAAALALAAILAFATLIALRASALAFATIHAFAVMLVGGGTGGGRAII